LRNALRNFTRLVRLSTIVAQLTDRRLTFYEQINVLMDKRIDVAERIIPADETGGQEENSFNFSRTQQTNIIGITNMARQTMIMAT
jgi:hypothetical protein